MKVSENCLWKKSQWVILVLLMITVNIYCQNAPPNLPQNASPLIYNFRVEENQESRVYFESSEPIWGSSIKGFFLTGKSLTDLKINSGQTSGHYFEVSRPFNFWDNNTIRYEGGSNLKDDDSNELNDFSLQYIKNELPEPKGNGNVYYVSINGNDSNSGNSESKAWRTIAHAAQKVNAGDIVYIKAGDYGNDKTKVKHSGTSSNPIKFIGYDNVIGDKPVLSRNQDTKLDSRKMPLIHSESSKGVGFSGGGKSFIIVKNIQLEGYKDAIDFEKSESCLLENIYVKGSSRFNILAMNSVSSKFIGCYSSNAGNSGIRYSGARTLIDGMYVSSRGNPNMDYLISLYGSDDGIGSIIINSSIVADPKDSHSQHGLSIKADDKKLENVLCENIYIQDVEQPIEVRHHEVSYSVFRNIQCVQVHANSSERSAGIVLLNGPHHNIFDNITVDGNYASIWFASSSEDKEAPDTAHDNVIMNSTFRNGQYVIRMAEDNYNLSRPLYNNYIINCTFYNHKNLYWNDHPKSRDNQFINCVFSGIEEEKVNPKGHSSGWDIMYSATYNLSWLKNGQRISGQGNISENPQFENASRGNFRLKSTSKLIDAGRKELRVSRDFDGNLRPQGSSHDIGAFEYSDGSSTSSVKANAGEDAVICKGEVVTLTGSGGSNYTWSTGETTESIKVSPTKATTYKVTVTDGVTTDTDEVTITVNNIVADAGNDVTIDEGNSIELTASGGDTYLWNNGETSESITVSPNTTTTYSVTVFKNGCEAVDEVEVNVRKNTTVPAIVADAGKDVEICLGEEVTLSASGGGTYAWDTGDKTQKIKVKPTKTTTYKVTVTDGVTTDTDEVHVIVNKVEGGASEDVSIYEGDAAKLTAYGGDSYIWNNGETTPSITVSPSQTETFSVQISSGDCQKTDEVKVVVSTQVSNPPPPNANAGEDQTICLGETVTLNAFGGTTFLWNTGQMSKSITVSPTRTTTYELIATRGGVDDSDKVTIVVENCKKDSDSEILTARDVQAYPNPTTGILKLNATNVQSDIDIHLINMNGKILYHDKIRKNNGGFSKQLDLSNFTKGIYFVRFTNAEQNAVKKIVLI